MFSIGDKEWPGLSKLNEECGEVIQIIGKLMATHGLVNHWEGSNLRDELEKELGDLLAAIEFVMTYNEPIDLKAIYARKSLKLRRFIQWHLLGDKNQDAIK